MAFSDSSGSPERPPPFLTSEAGDLTRSSVDEFVRKTDDAVVLIRDKQIVDANAAAVEILSLAPDSVIGKPLRSVFVEPFVDPDHRGSADDRLLDRLCAGLPVAVGGSPSKSIEFSGTEVSPIDDGVLLLGSVAEVTALPAGEPLERHRDFQLFLLQLSDRLSSTPIAAFEWAVKNSMREVIERYNADRITLLWLDSEQKEALRALQVGVDARSGEELVGPFSRLPWLTQQLQKNHNQPILFPDDLPPDAEEEFSYFARFDVKSCLLAPIRIDSEMVGVTTISTVFDERKWLREDRVELTLLCQRLGRTWAKHHVDRRAADREADLNLRIAFQTRLARISAEIATSPPENVRKIIDQALVAMAEDYGFDRARLWRSEIGEPNSYLLHEWVKRAEYRTDTLPVTWSQFPWLAQRAREANFGPIAIPDDLPAEADADRKYFSSLGVKSGLLFPIVVDGELVSVFGVAAIVERRRWDEREKTELMLLMQTITSALLQRLSEQKIRDRELDLARSQRVAAVGSFSVSANGEPPITEENAVFSISAEAARLFDVAPGEETLRELIRRIHSEDRGRVYRARSKSLQDGSGLTLDYRVVRTDGSVIHIEDRAEVDRDEHGRIVRLFGTYQDVTERVITQRELERAVSEIEALKDRFQAENVVLREEARAAQSHQTMVGSSKALRAALATVRKVAPTDVTVLVLGETGTGKELVARALHEQSDRSEATLISVNCAALSSELIESELFGHEAGAFTGAHKQRRGRFELADRGTLFLDEIGDLPLGVQAKLLRVLQTGEFQRLGGNKTLHSDVRVIVATNRDLTSMIEREQFRADLFFRINNFPIELPPLRDRREDIPALAKHFVDKHAAQLGKRVSSISAETIQHLLKLPWPGNVRELEGYMQRALISSEGPVLHHIESSNGRPTLQQSAERTSASVGASDDLAAMQRRHIEGVLERCNWVISGERGAATALGVPPSSLRSRMKRLGIRRT